MCMFSYHAYASEQSCSADIISVNNFNNFVFAQERPFNDPLKEMNLHITSKDNYINNTTQAKFDECGALLTLTTHEVVKFTIKERTLVTSIDATMRKQDNNWVYKTTFKLSILDEGNIETALTQQKINGKYLTDSSGKVIKSEDFSLITVGDERRRTKAVTTFLVNENGQLSESNRMSTLENDNVKTTYLYDPKNRLIRMQSDSTVEEFTYGDDDRELSNKTVKEFFTTETTVTTCKSWNTFGRCTQAEQHISTLIKDEHGGKDSVYNHRADVKYDYVY